MNQEGQPRPSGVITTAPAPTTSGPCGRTFGIDPLLGTPRSSSARTAAIRSSTTPTTRWWWAPRLPLWRASSEPRFSIRAFSASVNLRYSIRVRRIRFGARQRRGEHLRNGVYYNLDRRALHDRWQKPGDKARFKAISIDDTTPMSLALRARENYIAGESISVGYETSARWLHVVGVQGASFRFYMNDIFRLASFKRGARYGLSFFEKVSRCRSACVSDPKTVCL